MRRLGTQWIALLGAAKVETQRAKTEPHECARQRVRDLVVHGAAVLRMRVADDRAPPDGPLSRHIENRLEPTRRAVDEQFFGDRCRRHRVRLMLSKLAKVTPVRRQASRFTGRRLACCWPVTTLLL